jgi:oxygen-independent coproporphyrinogen-3 oxidase
VAPGQLPPLGAGRAPAPAEGGSPLGALAGARPSSRRAGLYLHVPFCTRRCHYCSFATAPPGAPDAIDAYVATLGAELGLLAAAPLNAPRLSISTLFFGGGTPSLLAPDQLAAVMAAVHAGFALAADAEITVECNPESVDHARLEAYRSLGVNRVSLGVQGLDDGLLATLGRLHDASGARRAFDAARRAGLDNVSVDLMYGLPHLDLDGWRRTVEAVLDWGPEHLSAYGLTLDGGSPWGTGGVDGLPPEETTVAQYWALAEMAAARGYEHYEISNYARPGFRSRHNLGYWRRREYLAAGLSACGFLGDRRWSNTRALPRYTAEVRAGRLAIDTAECLTPRQARAEALILGLRTSEGVPAAALDERAGDDAALRDRLAGWREQGWLVAEGDRVRLTEAGFLVSDALFVELL